MFLEAEVSLAFNRPTARVRVAAPSWGGRVLHWLTLGRASQIWERESFEPEEIVARLTRALAAAGIDDVVSVSADDEVVYYDERRVDEDMQLAMERLRSAAADQTDGPARIEVVAEHFTDDAHFVIQLVGDRVHPLDTPPIRLRVFALFRDLNLTHAGDVGYRGAATPERAMRQRMLTKLGTPDAYQHSVESLRAAMLPFCESLERALREHLETHPAQAYTRCSVVRPRNDATPQNVPTRSGLENAPLFRGYPGHREATYYLRVWLKLLQLADAEVRRTLFVDEGGRPIFHIQDEPVRVAKSAALTSGGDITDALGVVDALYFAGNDYESELRAGLRIPTSDAPAGEAAWELIRAREIGVKHIYLGLTAGQIWGDAPPLGGTNWGGDRGSLSDFGGADL
ncbi:MAG: hypothetical protein AAF721_07745 [Myxococcota bacterium]